tara:strand:+ start:6432 stop:6695 length:264 start_codon:yes stop_codon:yes gene_type:complete
MKYSKSIKKVTPEVITKNLSVLLASKKIRSDHITYKLYSNTPKSTTTTSSADTTDIITSIFQDKLNEEDERPIIESILEIPGEIEKY